MALTLIEWDGMTRHENENDLTDFYDGLYGSYLNYSTSDGPVSGAGYVDGVSIFTSDALGLRKNLPDIGLSWALGWWARGTQSNTGYNSGPALLDTAITAYRQISFRYTSTGISVRQGSTEILFAEYPVGIDAGAWKFVEVFVVQHDSAGSVVLRINGQTINSVSGIDTLYSSSSTGMRQIDICPISGVDIGPWYIGTATSAADLLGPVAVKPLVPTADTAEEDFTPSSGSDSYAMVDELTADDDSTYLSGTADGDAVALDCASVPAAFGDTVVAIKAYAKIKATDFTSKSLKIGVKSSTSEDQSSSGFAPSLSYYREIGHIAALDPNTSAAWTEAGVNAANVRLEIAAP